MRSRFVFSITLAFVLFSCVLIATAQNSRKVTSREVDSIVEAIQDEIYAYSYQKNYSSVGKELKSGSQAIPVYIQPEISKNGTLWTVYKLMPVGEVYRMFTIRGDGTAIAYGDSDSGFPPTQPSYLTAYMDDTELCKIKQEWSKHEFVIQLAPSKETLRNALARQEARTGFVPNKNR
jgi:hypothetical protein